MPDRNEELEQLDDDRDATPGGQVQTGDSMPDEGAEPGAADVAGDAEVGGGGAGTEEDPLRTQVAGGRDSA